MFPMAVQGPSMVHINVSRLITLDTAPDIGDANVIEPHDYAVTFARCLGD